MKITMIGDRGCGKTTFMAGLYRDMSNLNLKIQLSDQDQRKHVDSIVAKLNCGEYPSATDFAQSYRFDFTIDQVKLLDFTWYDYRGDALLGGSDSQESQQLFQEIEQSDGLLVFIDSTTFENPKWDIHSNYWGTILQAVRHHAILANKDNNRSLGIVFSKMDKKVEYKSPHPVKDNIDNLISTLPNRDYLSGILASSAVMKDRSVNTVNVFISLMTPFINKTLEEQAYKRQQVKEMTDLFKVVSDNYHMAGFLDDLLCGLDDNPSSRDKVNASIRLIKSYPLYESFERQCLIDSFLKHWNNRSFLDDVLSGLFGDTSQSDIAYDEFKRIANIWNDFYNEINTLYGDWSEKILKDLKENSDKEGQFYHLF